MCSSPKLFAAYHVLRRLSVPRHPSCALSSLTTKNFSRLATEAHFLLSTKFSFCSGTKVRPLSSASTCSVLAAFFKTLYNIFNFQSTCRSCGIFIRLRTNPLVELKGIEPSTSCLQSTRSGQLSYSPVQDGGRTWI